MKRISDIEVHCAFDKEVDMVDLVPHPRNPNKHSDRQIALLAKIIGNQGWRNPIVISERSGFIVAGHGRLGAARVLNVQKVPVDVQAFENEAEEYAHLIADNRIAELAEADRNELVTLIREMEGKIDLDLTGFDAPSLEELFGEDAVNEVDAEPQVDKADELKGKWQTALGQVWELGDHRLMCGDSTDTALVEQLLGKGKAAMVFTDPPYNIDYGNIKHPKFKVRSIENDSMSDADWKAFCQSIADSIETATEGCVYVCHAPNNDGRTIASVMDSNFHPSTTVIWNKDVFTLGRGKYQNKHEPIWFGWVKSGNAFTDKRDLANVWDLPRPKASELH
ncbi:MAG: ParB N-terminal domain-containing protein, partial [Verrucomicrobiota bacterium]|nr:ParB N-terminal domain-containing protein [Verrucomicrobiota bacterium]